MKRWCRPTVSSSLCYRTRGLVLAIFLLQTAARTTAAMTTSTSTHNHIRDKKVAVLALRTTSHENQLLGLATALTNEFDTVYLALNDDSPIQAPAPLKRLSAGPLPHDMSYWHYTHTLPDFLQFQADASLAAFDTLLQQLIDLEIDVVVFDPLFPLGHALCERLMMQQSNANKTITPVAVSCGSLFIHFVGHEGPLAPFLPTSFDEPQLRRNLLARTANAVAKFVGGHAISFLRWKLHRPFWQHVGLPPPRPYLYGSTRPLLTVSVDGLEPDANARIRLLPLLDQVGPLYPRPGPALAPEVRRFVDQAKQAVVLVSIGTNSVWTPDWWAATLQALQVLAKERGIRSIVATKPHQREGCDLSLLQDHPDILLVDYVEQFALLAEPKLQVFLTHGGLSSVTEALYHGVGLVICPGMLDSDQPGIGRKVARAGMGLYLPRTASRPPTRDEIAAALQQSLDEPGNTEQWQNIVRSRGNAAQGAQAIASYLRDGYQHRWRAEALEPWWKARNIDVGVTLATVVASMVWVALQRVAIWSAIGQFWKAWWNRKAKTM